MKFSAPEGKGKHPTSEPSSEPGSGSVNSLLLRRKKMIATCKKTKYLNTLHLVFLEPEAESKAPEKEPGNSRQEKHIIW